jgi:hypothetical protein
MLQGPGVSPERVYVTVGMTQIDEVGSQSSALQLLFETLPIVHNRRNRLVSLKLSTLLLPSLFGIP